MGKKGTGQYYETQNFRKDKKRKDLLKTVKKGVRYRSNGYLLAIGGTIFDEGNERSL